MRRAVLAAWVLGCAGCQAPTVGFEVMRPDFSTLLNLPGLAGVVTVHEDGLNGTVAGSANVRVEGETFTARLPNLPLDQDLFVTLEWTSSDVLIAGTAGNVVRVKADATTTLHIGAADYLYPDNDQDGAPNIFEVACAASDPEAEDPVNNPLVAPAGFFDQVAAAYVMPGWSLAAAIDTALDSLYVDTFDTDDEMTTASGHALQVVDLGSRKRYTTPISCPSDSILVDIVKEKNERAAVLCKRHDGMAATDAVSILDPMGADAPTFLRSVETWGAGSLFHGSGGNRVFAVGPSRLYVLDLYAVSPLVETIFVGVALSPVELTYGIDVGQPATAPGVEERLLVTDAIGNALIVFDSAGGEWSVRRVMADAFSSPQQIAVHPSGTRAYVANSGDDLLRVVDTSSSDPAQWSVVAGIPVGTASTAVAIEPNTGAFVYATSAEKLIRIDTLTNLVSWQLEPGGDSAFLGVVLGDNGTQGVLVTDRSVLSLSFGGGAGGKEIEPNQAPDESSNRLVVPGSSFGWADYAEEGTLSTTWQWRETGGVLRQSVDDFEDVWRLEPTGAEERLAIAIVPAHTFQNIAVALVDTNVRETAFYWGIGVRPGIAGNGVFLLTPPLATVRKELSIAVSAFDMGLGSSAYELVVAPMPATIPTVQEHEPNNSWTDARDISATLPVEVAGTIDGAETGVSNNRDPPIYDDLEDCYRVKPWGRRLAVRLQPVAANLDVNLLPYDSTSTRLVGSVYFRDAAGEPEYLILEPRAELLEVMLCVGVFDSDPVTTGDYRLLILDLGI